ncbi:MAG: twin-arginine translocase TatA/TatE family subunit [Candidatus Syntrophonatronum acetioxidans]|uniref:Sec-independent protein translocase protein TatA n=1 Tax=Candidatus Syntrophonatronum acetioxidans TaxID=1795816 RepID=A0A424YIM9_9FIRM|nr:MAG: twin-arginine translocase TatA/TatE family subunit [Candidatus Syntrophonatronum acetioxidans]
MIGRLGTTELLIILGIILVIFGPSKLPEIGKSLGRGIREFKSATKDLKDSINVEDDIKSAGEQAEDPKKPEPVESSSQEPTRETEQGATETEQTTS